MDHHRYKNKEYVVDKFQSEDLYEDATTKDIANHKKHYFDSIEVICLMLTTMVSEFQKSFENLGSYEMDEQLKKMFQDQA